MSSYKWLVDKHFKKNCCYVIRNYIPTNLKYEQVYKNQLNVFNTSTPTTLICRIKGSTRLGLQRVFSTKNLLIRHQPIYFKRKFHPRQDVYYILFAILFSNISKTYKSKTLIVNHFCPGRLYFRKLPHKGLLL